MYDHVIEYVGGRPVREGRGLSFIYLPSRTNIVSVPVGSKDVRFDFRERTSDFQRIRVEGEIIYRVTSPRKAASSIDFTVRGRAKEVLDEPTAMLRRRVLSVTRDVLRDELGRLSLKEALTSGTQLGRSIRIRMSHSHHLKEIGVSVIGVFVKEVRGPPDMAKALEAACVGQATMATDPGAFDTLLVARSRDVRDGADAAKTGGHASSIECNESCPFRHMCEDYMGSIRGGKAWCTLFREFSM